jgi:hypothetical protein
MCTVMANKYFISFHFHIIFISFSFHFHLCTYLVYIYRNITKYTTSVTDYLTLVTYFYIEIGQKKLAELGSKLADAQLCL